MTYKFLSHTADVKFTATEKNLERMFTESARALFETIYGKIKIQENQKKEIKIKGKDTEELLYNFLEEFLYLLDAKNFIPSKVKEIKISNGSLTSQNLGNTQKIGGVFERSSKSVGILKSDEEKIKRIRLTAVISGDNADHYTFTNDVKAVTYSDMKIEKQKDKFTCTVVLDV